jgi:hypothetical protein
MSDPKKEKTGESRPPQDEKETPSDKKQKSLHLEDPDTITGVPTDGS